LLFQSLSIPSNSKPCYTNPSFQHSYLRKFLKLLLPKFPKARNTETRNSTLGLEKHWTRSGINFKQTKLQTTNNKTNHPLAFKQNGITLIAQQKNQIRNLPDFFPSKNHSLTGTIKDLYNILNLDNPTQRLISILDIQLNHLNTSPILLQSLAISSSGQRSFHQSLFQYEMDSPFSWGCYRNWTAFATSIRWHPLPHVSREWTSDSFKETLSIVKPEKLLKFSSSVLLWLLCHSMKATNGWN